MVDNWTICTVHIVQLSITYLRMHSFNAHTQGTHALVHTHGQAFTQMYMHIHTHKSQTNTCTYESVKNVKCKYCKLLKCHKNLNCVYFRYCVMEESAAECIWLCN